MTNYAADNNEQTFDFEHRHPWHRALARELSRAMRKPVSAHLRRLESEWRLFASLTMDFIIDVVDVSSFWHGYESWNRRHFGVALPVTEGEPGMGLTDARLNHFVWKLLAVMAPDFSLPPGHPDVRALTETIGVFWEKRKNKFVPISDSSAFCAGSNNSGWEVKGKLVTLGETTYFFRMLCAEYLFAHTDYDHEFGAVDDFLCQTCSPWSGMGPIDLLAEVLELPEERRADIRSWSQRHAAPYLVDSMDPNEILVTNLATDIQYRVERDYAVLPFRPGMVLFGFLAPWNGRWRWSGVQQIMGEGKEGIADAKTFVGKMRRDCGGALCCYWPEYRRQVGEIARELHSGEFDFHGGRDLVRFESVDALMESRNAFFSAYCRKRLDDAQSPDPDDLPPLIADTKFPDDVKRLAGAALFLSPDEGAEIMAGYDALVAALEKNNGALTEEERGALREFVQSTAISPAFVHRVLQDMPAGAIKAEFGMSEDAPGYWLEWLFRCWKGEYYRIHYPLVSMA